MQVIQRGALRATTAQSYREVFSAASIIVIVACAVFAATAPTKASLIAFALFGGLHNFVEIRYFLSRFPSRLGPLKPFFITSVIGVSLLFTLELATIVLVRMRIISSHSLNPLWLIWNELLILWILALSAMRYRDSIRQILPGNIMIALLASVGNLLSPYLFTLSISYVHPLIGLWIMDRELLRSRKDWVNQYRCALMLVPVSAGCVVWWLQGHSISGGIFGAPAFASAGSPMFVGLFAFLQMVHYGVWIFAIPIASQSWKRWRLESLAVLRGRPSLRRLAAMAICLGMLAVAVFWMGCAIDPQTTNEVYATIAIFHILAEVPLLFFMCES